MILYNYALQSFLHRSIPLSGKSWSMLHTWLSTIGKIFKRLDNHLSSHHKGISRSMNDSKTVFAKWCKAKRKMRDTWLWQTSSSSWSPYKKHPQNGHEFVPCKNQK